MKLPSEILVNLNIGLSRHKFPESLDWTQNNGKWVATDEGKSYTVVYDENLGYVIAERKSVGYSVS